MLIAVGGHSRNIGKTSVVCGIIAALREYNWQAFKITQHGHNICVIDGHGCDCAPGDPTHPYAIDEQRDADDTDTGRYLRAGAKRSWWVRTAQGELGHAVPELKKLFAAEEYNIVESNSVLQFVRPDFYVSVLDYGVADFKDSSRLYVERADAFVVETRGLDGPAWAGVPQRWLEGKPCFAATELETVAEGLIALIRGQAAQSVVAQGDRGIDA